MADKNVALFGPEASGKTTLHEGLFKAAEYVTGDAELYSKGDRRVLEFELEGISWAIYDFNSEDALTAAAQNGELDAAVMVVNCDDGPIGLHDTMFMLEDCDVPVVACAATRYDSIENDKDTKYLVDCEIREVFDEHAMDGDEATVVYINAEEAADGDEYGISVAYSLLEALAENIG